MLFGVIPQSFMKTLFKTYITSFKVLNNRLLCYSLLDLVPCQKRHCSDYPGPSIFKVAKRVVKTSKTPQNL